MKKAMTCIICPRGCALEVEATTPPVVSGAACKRGVDYATSELVDPRRVLTSTVRVLGGRRRRFPVRSALPIPLPRLVEAARALDSIVVTPPLACGSVVAADWLGLGADLLAADDLE
jgi:CxxC motif-containing protein